MSHSGEDALEELLGEAESALDRGDFEAALDLLDEAAHDEDGHPEARALYGLTLYYKGAYDDAFEYLEEALAEDPEDVEARGALGVCHFFRLEVVTAEKELRRALLSEPDWAEAHYWLGRVLEWRGRMPEAELEFESANRLDPDDYPSPHRLADEDLDRVMKDAIATLPPRIRKAIDEVAILVEEYPDEHLLKEADPPFPPDLLGLFTGTSLAERSTLSSGAAPNTIHVFKRNIELYGGNREEVVAELRVTLLHEIGHYLGLDEEELEALGLE